MKRFLIGILVVCLLVGCLSGCGKEQTQSGAGISQEAAISKTSATADEQVEGAPGGLSAEEISALFNP